MSEPKNKVRTATQCGPRNARITLRYREDTDTLDVCLHDEAGVPPRSFPVGLVGLTGSCCKAHIKYPFMAYRPSTPPSFGVGVFDNLTSAAGADMRAQVLTFHLQSQVAILHPDNWVCLVDFLVDGHLSQSLKNIAGAQFYQHYTDGPLSLSTLVFPPDQDPSWDAVLQSTKELFVEDAAVPASPPPPYTALGKSVVLAVSGHADLHKKLEQKLTSEGVFHVSEPWPEEQWRLYVPFEYLPHVREWVKHGNF